MWNYGKLYIDDPGMFYFTADPHFFHAGIIGLCQRPFKDVEEMNNALADNWNAVVPEKGVVLVLGDMFHKAADMEKNARLMRRLHGKKYLVAGNHDKFAKEEYIRLGFADAWDYLELVVTQKKRLLIVCCHYPLLEWNGFYRGAWHLHGHAHGKCPPFSARILDVGVDAQNFMPVSFFQIERELADGWELDKLLMQERGAAERHTAHKLLDESGTGAEEI